MFGLLHVAAAKIHARRTARDLGYRLRDANELASGVDAAMLEEAAEIHAASTGAPIASIMAAVNAVGAVGDGSLWEKILAFFNTDIGKAILDILMKLLLGLLV